MDAERLLLAKPSVAETRRGEGEGEGGGAEPRSKACRGVAPTGLMALLLERRGGMATGEGRGEREGCRGEVGWGRAVDGRGLLCGGGFRGGGGRGGGRRRREGGGGVGSGGWRLPVWEDGEGMMGEGGREGLGG